MTEVHWLELAGIHMPGGEGSDGFFVESIAGWDELPDARGSLDPIPQAHGSFGQVDVWRGSRVVTVAGKIVAGDRATAEAYRARLLNAFPGMVVLRVSDAQGILNARVRVDNVRPTDMGAWSSYIPFTIDLVAPDPIRYRDQVTLGPVGLPVRGRPGVAPVVLDVNYAPSFSGPTTPVEVRRNYVTQPLVSQSTTRWSFRTAAVTDAGPVFEGRRLTVDKQAVPANNFIAEPAASFRPTAPANTLVRSRVVLRNPGSVAYEVRLVGRSWAPSQVDSFGGLVTIQPGASVELAHSFTTPGASGLVNFTLVAGSVAVPLGAEIVIEDGWAIEIAPLMGGVFSDPDLSFEWTGPVNASESRLMGRHLAALTDNNCVSFLTADNSEIRLVPTGPSTDSFTRFQVPVGARGGGVFSAQKRLVAPISDSAPQRTGLFIGIPDQNFPSVNTAGTHAVRAEYAPITSWYAARLWHGGSVGSGEVRWSKVGLNGPDSPGEYFGIETPRTQQGEGVVYTRWQGGVVGGPVEKVYEVPAQGQGLRLPKRFPWSFGYNTQPAAEVENTGSVPAYPTVTVTGKADAITINIGPRRVEYGAFDGVLVIDHHDRRAHLNGIDVTRQLIRRDWAAIPPGDTWTATFDATSPTPDTSMTVEYRNGAF